MEAKKLRIGNWVQDEHGIAQYVYRLWKGGAELAEDENGGDDLDYTEDEIFGIPITEEWLLKFSENQNFKSDDSKPIKLIYTGNITSGRWETLVKIGEALDKINKSYTKATLSIYTKNQLHGKIDKAFKEIKSIEFKGSIDANQVKEVQNRGDILVHVESMKLKEKLETRLSFSTKLVDWLDF